MRYLLLLILAVGAIAFCLKRFPPPAPPADDTFVATPQAPQGILGEEIRAGDVFIEITQLQLEKVPAKGVAIAGVLAYIGNASNGPLNAPPVKLFLYDEQNRQYAAKFTDGKYQQNVQINPLLRLEHRWAFVVPLELNFVRALFVAGNTGQATIDLRQRTAKNNSALADGTHADALAALNKLMQRAGAQGSPEETQLADKRGELEAELKKRMGSADAAWDIADRAADSLKSLDEKIAALTAQVEKADKKLKSLEKQVADCQEDYKKAREAQARATNSLRVTMKQLEDYLKEKDTSRDDRRSLTLNNQVAKARAELARQDDNAREAQDDAAKKTKALTEQRDAANAVRAELKQAQNEHARQLAAYKPLEAAAQQADEKVRDLEVKLAPAPVAPPTAPPEEPSR